MNPLIREYSSFVPFNPIEYVWIDFASGPLPTDESSKALSEKLRAFPYGVKDTLVDEWPLPFEKTCMLLPIALKNSSAHLIKRGVMVVTLERANGKLVFELWTGAQKDQSSLLIETTSRFYTEDMRARVSPQYAEAVKKSFEECADHGRQILTVALRRIVALALLGDPHAVTSRPSYIGSAFLNKKRIKKGKRPFFEWTTVEVKPRVTVQEPKGGTHASPKPHMRRGHVRRLKSGKIVAVKPMVINKHKMPDEGFVFHDYKVAALT